MESESNGDAELPATDSPSGSSSKTTEKEESREFGDNLQNTTQLLATNERDTNKVTDNKSETQTGTDDDDQPDDIKDFQSVTAQMDEKKESEPEEEKGGSKQQTLSSELPESNLLQISVPGNEKEVSGPQIKNNSWPKPESTKEVDEENVNKSERKEEGLFVESPSNNENDDSTQQTLPPDKKVTDNKSETQTGRDEHDQPVDIKESPPGIQSLDESKVAKDVNETSSEFSHRDEEDEDEDQDQDLNKQTKQKPEPVLESLEPTTSSRLQKSTPMNIMGGNEKLMWICAGVVIVLSVVGGLYQHFSDSSQPAPKELNVVDVFNQEMEKLKASFPTQRPELWRRSLIHLRRHLKTENPTEPVSLILTSGHGAERTLGCLAQCLARAFSTARNSSVLKINGKSKASQDSDQVKLEIDSELRKAFEGETFAAVIHHFEELPPGSTLIFYRYCDHENAAYKNVFLAFTVMLDTEVEVPSNINLGIVEEMVQEHVKQKFVSSDKSAMFNQMDVDKLSGLWSRISHLILPVAAEENIEQQGCRDCD